MGIIELITYFTFTSVWQAKIVFFCEYLVFFIVSTFGKLHENQWNQKG